MEIKIAYRHLESTPSIDEKIREKAEKLKKFFDGKMHVDWTCSVEKDVHSSEVKVTGDHFTYHASAEADSLYKTIDESVHKLEKQILKKKEMLKSKKRDEPHFE